MKRSVQYASMLVTLLSGSVVRAGSHDLPNYSAYGSARAVAGPTTNQTVPSEFLAGVGGIDEQRGVPTIYWAPSNGVLAPGGIMAHSEEAAQFYLEHYAALYGLGDEALKAAQVKAVHELPGGGVLVVFEQKTNGIEVYHTTLKVMMTSSLELVTLTGNLHAAAGTTSRRVAPFTHTPEDAVARSFNDFFRTNLSQAAFQNNKQPQHGYDFFTMDDAIASRLQNMGLARPARVKKVYYPMPEQLVPAYYVELATSKETSASVLYSYVIAADDGRLLERVSLTHDAAFQYRVWNEGAPNFTPPDGPQADFAPHPTGMPDGSTPPFVASNLVTIDGLNTNPGGTFDPWLAAGATSTNGNNVDAYADLAAPDGLSGADFRAPTSAAGVFDWTYNTAQQPTGTNQRRAAITQLFVDNNYYHDYWYNSGFDEASGNAQANNYGRGGLGGDPIRAEAQDYSGTDNANMQTPADGTSPIMQMYVFSPPQAGGSINRDGAIDNGIVGHEWGHYLHFRLAAGGNQQMGAMSEGWGDFMSVIQLIHPNDSANNFGGTFATGVYAAAAFGDSGYYGIRRYPYSTTFAKNGLTFKHIGNGQALPPGTAPGFGGIPNSEVHNAGEIWTTMLWEAYSNLLEDTLGATPRHTFDQAKRKMANYVVGGLKAVPVDPLFTEQRDSILAAALAGGDAADLQDLMAGFATRGIGPCAVSPTRTSTTLTGVVEDFMANRANAAFRSVTISDATPSCDSDGVLDVGEGGVITVNVQNNGWGPLTGATVTVTSANANVQFPSGNSGMVPTTASLSTGSTTIPVTLGAGITTATYIPLTIVINAPGACSATVNATGSGEVHYNVTVPNSVNGVTTEAWEGTKTWSAKTPAGVATTLWAVNRPTVPAPIGINEVAWGQDIGSTSDHRYESPDLVVGNGSVSMTFQHRYQFEQSGGENWDGGVIEYTQDGGMTWNDVSTLGATGYTGPITTTSDNPMPGRQAYVGATGGFATGTMVNRTINLGATLANKTIRIRFRIGTDGAVGAGGWFIDDLAFTGLANKPFSAQVPHSCAMGPVCGDGVINGTETCDDGNTASGDCCSATCQIEAAGTVCRAATNRAGTTATD